MRKLAPEDRIAGAIRLALEFNVPYDRILYAMICGCRFRARDELGQMSRDDLEFSQIYTEGIDAVLTRVCCFDPTDHNTLYLQAIEIDNNLTLS
jgi:hypothetical protein